MNIRTLIILLSLPASGLLGAVRDIQFKSINFVTSVVEMHNYGTASQSLAGWRFCTHDENQIRRYSSTTGLNAVSIAPGESLFIHYLNDAPGGDSAHLNRSALGNFATPLDSDAYGIQIYFRTPFGAGANIADHLQWSIDGIDDLSADERSDEAEAGGVWVKQSEWISTTADTTMIQLDADVGALNQPSHYTVIEPVAATLEITNTGLLDPDTFFVAFAYSGSGTVKVTESKDLDTFTDVSARTAVSTPTPNRVEFDITGSSLFFRMEED